MNKLLAFSSLLLCLGLFMSCRRPSPPPPDIVVVEERSPIMIPVVLYAHFEDRRFEGVSVESLYTMGERMAFGCEWQADDLHSGHCQISLPEGSIHRLELVVNGETVDTGLMAYMRLDGDAGVCVFPSNQRSLHGHTFTIITIDPTHCTHMTE